MKKFILSLVIVISIVSSVNAQFANFPELESNIKLLESKEDVKPQSPQTPLNKEEFKRYRDSFMRIGIKFTLTRMDSLGSVLNQVKVNKFSLPNTFFGNATYVFKNKDLGFIEEIFIEGKKWDQD
jgi:hypothetical protein